MSRSLITSLALALLVCADFAGVAPGRQTGPYSPPAPALMKPEATAHIAPRQMYDALLALDPRVKCRITDDERCCLFMLHLPVGDELRPVVVAYDLVKPAIRITMPLSMPYISPMGPFPAELADRITVLNRQIAPCEINSMRTQLEPDSWELVTDTILKGPTTLQDFQARLKLLLESVATSKPIWSTLPQK
jgi:hypothetical protein